jgi:hypothetical protein
MIYTGTQRKKTNVPERTKKENIYVSMHDSRTKEDIDGIHIYDKVTKMIEKKKEMMHK